MVLITIYSVLTSRTSLMFKTCAIMHLGLVSIDLNFKLNIVRLFSQCGFIKWKCSLDAHSVYIEVYFSMQWCVIHI